MATEILTAQRLREILDYDPFTGHFKWLVKIAHRVEIGHYAGSINKRGYVCIRANKRGYQAHRLAWLHFYGSWPDDQIDHINGIKSDNRIVNLRDSTNCTNGQNKRSAYSHNKLGILGVKRKGLKFTTRIVINGRDTHLGTFPTAELAHAAYLAAKREHHAGCTI